MSRFLLSFAAIFTALALASCQSETVQSGSGPVMSPQAQTVDDSAAHVHIGKIDPTPPPPTTPSPVFHGLNAATDPCAAQLQDLCGALLFAYVQNKKLPDTLEELAPYAAGATLSYNCPVSGKHYTYTPAGLHAQNIHDILIVYDPDPVHNGQRWGIVMTPNNTANPTMFVIPLNQKLFNAYQQK